MRQIVIDTENTFSLRDFGKPKKETDYASPFYDENKCVVIGAYTPHNKQYKQYWLGYDDLTPLKQDIANSDVIIGQNIKYDVNWLERLGIDCRHAKQDDVLIREYVLRGGVDKYDKLKLDLIAPIYGGSLKVDIMKKLWKSGVNVDQIDKAILSDYLRGDVANTWRVWCGQEQHPNRKRFDAILNMKRDLNGVVQRMEQNGFHINLDKAKEIKSTFDGYAAEAEVVINDLVSKVVKPKLLVTMPSSFFCEKEKKEKPMNSYQKAKWMREMEIEEDLYAYNPNASMQKMELLYGLKFRSPESKKVWAKEYVTYKTQEALDTGIIKHMERVIGFNAKPFPNKSVVIKTGLAASRNAIEALSTRSQPALAKEFMEATKDLNAKLKWIDNINPMIYRVASDGKVHTSFNIAGTDSGRFSSSSPNCQNLPSKKKHGGINNVRECVVSRFGDEGKIIAIDYSQLELRFVMEMVKSHNGMKDYINNVDMHSATAQQVYDADHGEGAFKALSEKDHKYWRGEAKAVNFGLLFGANPKTEIAKRLTQAFYDRYPEVTSLHQDIESQILMKKEYVNSMTGWAYAYKNATEDNFWSGYSQKGGGWRNKSRNQPIQGGANELIQVASIPIDDELKYDDNIFLIGQVHDELVFDCHKKGVDK